MKYFKTYESFKGTEFLKDPVKIKAWLDEMEIKNYTIGKDGKVDVNGRVVISKEQIKKIPVQFRKVDEFFVCFDNQLTSLKGAPEKVGGDFYCNRNQLTSLKGAPKEVGGDFWCHYNQLTSLEGAPNKVGKNFICYNNKLISLEGAPEKVGGDFGCYNNQLINLVGMPNVRGTVEFNNNRGIPSEILYEVYKLMKKNKTDWDTEIKKYIQYDPTIIKYLPKEELKRLGLDKESKLKSGGLL